MYVLVLEDGYLQIEGNSEEGYECVTYENGIDCELRINGRFITVPIIPTGHIVINSFNENLQKYLEDGGTVEEVLRFHENKKIKLNPPFPPQIANIQKQAPVLTLDQDTDFDLPYIPSCYMEYMGKMVTLFHVSNINELYFYDLMRLKLKKNNNNIRLCVDCGKAFLANTTAKRCDNCKTEGNKRVIQENREGNPENTKLYAIINRAGKRKELSRFRRESELDDYEKYLKGLRKYIKDNKKGLSQNSLALFGKKVEEIDKHFYSLWVFIADGDDPELKDEWNKARLSLWNQSAPEQWLKEWYKKVGKKW